jgi:hypothetical protein
MRVTSDMSAAMAELGGPPTSSETEPVIKDCPILPFGQTNALHRRIVHWRFLQVPFQPNLKEVIVAVTVMAVTIVVSLSGMMLVW